MKTHQALGAWGAALVFGCLLISFASAVVFGDSTALLTRGALIIGVAAGTALASAGCLVYAWRCTR